MPILKNLAEINALFVEADKIHKRLKALSPDNVVDPDQSDTYWATHNEMKVKLSEILRENFVLFSKPRLCKFLSLCSSFRPLEPHQILTRIASQFEEFFP